MTRPARFEGPAFAPAESPEQAQASGGAKAVGRVTEELKSLGAVLSLSPEDARALLVDACLRHPVRCPRCGEGRCYELGRERRRCSRCLYTFRLFIGRWAGRLRIPPKRWLIVLKCFELGMSGPDTGKVSGLSAPTIYRALETVRLSLISRDPEWASLFTQPGLPPLIFGVRQTCGAVRLERVSNGAAMHGGAAGPRGGAAGLRGGAAGLPRVLHRNGFAYTSACAGYDALVCHGRVFTALAGRATESPEVPPDPFLRFLINQTTKHFGIPLKTFPLYIKEQEFRFNHLGLPLFPLLLDSIARYAPPRPGSGPPRPARGSASRT